MEPTEPKPTDLPAVRADDRLVEMLSAARDAARAGTYLELDPDRIADVLDVQRALHVVTGHRIDSRDVAAVLRRVLLLRNGRG